MKHLHQYFFYTCISISILLAMPIIVHSSDINTNAEPILLSKNEIFNVKSFDYPSNTEIQWDGWKVWSGWESGNLISGKIKMSLIDDSVYPSMKLPSELPTVWSYRQNPILYHYKPNGYINTLGTGGVYPVPGEILPDNFNVYVGKFSTYVLYNGATEWKLLDYHNNFDSPIYFGFFKLPSGGGTGTTVQYETSDSFTKFSLNSANLDNAMLHFWGTQMPSKSEDILGLVTIYEIWTDTPEVVGKICATVGNDQRNSTGEISQAFSGRNYAITTEKRIVIGHNIPDDIYEWCVNNNLSPNICYEMFINQ